MSRHAPNPPRRASRRWTTLCALALALVASGCGTDAQEGQVVTDTGPTIAHLRADTGGEDAYAGVNFTVVCRAFEADTSPGAAPDALGPELPLPGAATVVVLDGPAAPIAIQGTKVALPKVGAYTVACRVPSAGLVDTVGARLEVVAGPATAMETRLRPKASPPTALATTLDVKAGTAVVVDCTGTDAWDNPVIDGWSLDVSPSSLVPNELQLQANKAGQFTVACRAAGTVDTTPATLTVAANVPKHLFALLDPEHITAGNAAKLGCVATDAWGNPIAGFPFAVDHSEDLTLKGLYVTSTVAGVHTVKCVPETDKWDLYTIHAAALTVRPGPASELIVARVPNKKVYKRDEKVKFPATVRDDWGNVRPNDGVTVAVLSPAAGWKVLEADPHKDKLVKFAKDATYKLRFEVEKTALSAELSVLVDGAPPLLTIEDPPWGSTLTGKPSVQIKGKAGDEGSGVKNLTVNGKTGYVDAANAWMVQHGAKHGLNMVLAVAEDMGGETTEATRGFYFSNAYYKTDAATPKGAMVKNAMQIFAGKKLFDDGVHDPYKPDDLATILELLMGSTLTSGLLPSNVSQGDLQVTLKNTKMGKPKVSLTPVHGGLKVAMRIDNISTDLKVKAKLKLGPIKTSVSVSGTVKMDSVKIDMLMKMAIQDGKATSSVANSNVKIDGMKLSVDGIAGLFNPLFNLLLGTYKKQIEAELKSALVGEIPKMLNDILTQLSVSETFEVPPTVGNAPTVKVTFITVAKELQFTPDGALLKFDATFVSAKGTKHTVLGSIARAGCIGTAPDTFVIDKSQRMQLAMHDDLTNQLLYAIWYGGAMTMSIPGSALGDDQALMGFSLDKATIDVDLLLPPILEACAMPKPSVIHLQVGDAFATMRLPIGSDELALYVAASVDMSAEVVMSKDKAGVPQIEVVPGKDVGMLIELTDISKNFAESKAAFGTIIKQLVTKELEKGLPGGDQLKIPLPPTVIDLSTLGAGVPAGSKVTLALTKLDRAGGYTAITAELQ